MLARVETAGAGLLRRDLTAPVRQGCRHNRVATVSPSGTTYELVFKNDYRPCMVPEALISESEATVIAHRVCVACLLLDALLLPRDVLRLRILSSLLVW